MSKEQKFTYPNFPPNLEFKEPHFVRYIKFIESRGLRKIPEGTYTEKHHIVPKSLGGSDEEENLITLTAREHFIAHMILWKGVGGSMTHSFWLLAHGKNGYNRNRLTGRQYEILRQAESELRSSMVGEKASFYGKKHSQETKDRISEMKKGINLVDRFGEKEANRIKEKKSISAKKMWENRTDEERKEISKKISENRVFIVTEEIRRNMIKARSEVVIPPEIEEKRREKISETSKRMWENRSEEEKKDVCSKISENAKGVPHPNAKGKKKTEEHRKKISRATKKQWENLSEEKKEALSKKMSQSAKNRKKKK